MSNFEKQLIDEFGGNFDKLAVERVESNFLTRFKSWVNKVASDFRMYDINLNDNIVKIAKENNLNKDQIQRIVENVNVDVFLDKYAKTRGGKERRVEFELADVEKIAAKLNIKVVPEKQVKNKEGGKLDKTASYNPVKLDSTTSSVEYFPKLWDSEKLAKERRNIISRRVLDKLASVQAQSYALTKELLWKIARVGDSLISYARMGEPIQEVFSDLVKEAALSKHTQHPICGYVLEKSAEMKSQYKLPKNVLCEISLVDMPEKAPYSLGKFSLLKEGSDFGKNYPDIISNGHFTTFKDLTSLAKELDNQIEKVR